MIIAQLSTKKVTFSEILWLVIAFMKVYYLTLSLARWIKSTQYTIYFNLTL